MFSIKFASEPKKFVNSFKQSFRFFKEKTKKEVKGFQIVCLNYPYSNKNIAKIFQILDTL